MSWPGFEWMFIMFNNFQKIIWELYPTNITGDITTIIIPERGWPQFIETCLEGGCPGQTRGQERTGLTSTLPAYHHHQQNNSNLFSWFSWIINTSGLNVRVGEIVKSQLMRYSSADWLRNILSGDFLIFLIWDKSFCSFKDFLAVSPNQILQDLQLDLYTLSKFVKGKNQYCQKFSDLVFQLKVYSFFVEQGLIGRLCVLWLFPRWPRMPRVRERTCQKSLSLSFFETQMNTEQTHGQKRISCKQFLLQVSASF